MISTHTPLARRDGKWTVLYRQYRISTHTPLARRDGKDIQADGRNNPFLLTRLSRGVTSSCPFIYAIQQFLLTRLSRGVTGQSECYDNVVEFLLTRLSRGVT